MFTGGKHSSLSFRSGKSGAAGVTLVELMIAVTILAMLASGFTASILYSRRLAELEIYQSSVHTAASGYLEQLKALPYSDLARSSLPTEPTAITAGAWNTPPAIDVNGTPDNANDDISFRVRPRLTDLRTDASAPVSDLSCYEIIIDYEYDSRLFGRDRTYSGSLRLIRSFVSTY